MGKRVVVTGGCGKAGQFVIPYLLQRGHQVLNLDIAPPPATLANVHTIKVDLTDSGQAYNAISSHFRLTLPFREPLFWAPDAIVHLAGYARNMLVPDNETFRGNAVGTYNVIEAACKLGVKKIVLASSITTYGVAFAEGDVDYPSFPVEETLDVNPMDTYAISKLCGERIGRGFARRFGVDVYALRIGEILAPEDYGTLFPNYVEHPKAWKVHGWSYMDARDLGQLCDLCLLKDGLGFQVFNATNDEITNDTPTEELLRRLCPDTPITRQLGLREAPITNRKAKELLGFREEHHWRKYYRVSS